MEVDKSFNGADYYGATSEAEERINRLLGFSASGREQDWEIEFADPGRIEEMFGSLREDTLDLESRSALWLLILASFETSLDRSQFNESIAKTAAELLSADDQVLNRMRFHWLGLNRSNYPEKMRIILSVS